MSEALAYSATEIIPNGLPSLFLNVRFWPKADVLKNAIDVAFGGKADMPFCTACLLLTHPGHVAAPLR